MAKFIEVTDLGGTKHLINTHWIEEIWDSEEGAWIFLGFSVPHAEEQDYVRTKESYGEVCEMLGV